MPALPNAELAVMELLWRKGRITGRQIIDRLYADAPKPQHGTVQRLLQRLAAKGFVVRDRSLGISVFSPAISRDGLRQRPAGVARKPAHPGLAGADDHPPGRRQQAVARRDREAAPHSGGGGMTGVLLQIGATKLAVSVVLAGVVWIVHRRVGRPAVSYPLWLLVLVTLLVPAVVSLPVLPVAPVVAPPPVVPLAAPSVGAPEVVLAEATFDSSTGPRLGALAQPGLAILWLVGTVGLLGWTLARTIGFRRTLTRALRPAPAWLQEQAAVIGRDLGLARIPELRTTSARVTPMVWWTGGKVLVLIPTFLLTELSREELRAILAHELAHVRRRDHLVRWVEWLACSAFWWNPVAWWARHQLRIAEESCCDQLAVGAARSCPRTYANALLRVVASTAEPPGFRPPLPASAAGGVGRMKALERRIRMIVSTDNRSPAPRWVRAATWMAVMCALPFGLIYCDRPTAPTAPMAADEETTADPAEGAVLDSPDELFATLHELVDNLSRREAEIQERIREAVESGELSERRGRELSAYVTGAASGRLSRYALDHAISGEEEQAAASWLIARSAERNRGLWIGDYSSRISTTDLQSPELRATLAEMQELIAEIGRTPDAKERFGEWRGRIVELNAKVRGALGRHVEGEW